MLITLAAALPVWTQFAPTKNDGTQGEPWYDDCGPLALATAIAVIRGTRPSRASITAQLGGRARNGLTNATDLVRVAALHGVFATVESPPARELEGWVTAWVHQCKPSLVLGTWPTRDSVLRWLVTVECGDRYTYANPWRGVRSRMRWPELESCYAGQIVAFDEAVNYDMHAARMAE